MLHLQKQGMVPSECKSSPGHPGVQACTGSFQCLSDGVSTIFQPTCCTRDVCCPCRNLSLTLHDTHGVIGKLELIFMVVLHSIAAVCYLLIFKVTQLPTQPLQLAMLASSSAVSAVMCFPIRPTTTNTNALVCVTSPIWASYWPHLPADSNMHANMPLACRWTSPRCG